MITTNSVISQMNAMASDKASSPASSEVSKTAFLELLVNQLRNQDPLSPMDSEQFMGQMAQFSSLEQQINLNDQFGNFLGFQALTQASSMIGKDVQAISYSGNENASLVQGKVDEVILLNGVPVLKLSSGEEVLLQAVVKVGNDLSSSGG